MCPWLFQLSGTYCILSYCALIKNNVFLFLNLRINMIWFDLIFPLGRRKFCWVKFEYALGNEFEKYSLRRPTFPSGLFRWICYIEVSWRMRQLLLKQTWIWYLAKVSTSNWPSFKFLRENQALDTKRWNLQNCGVTTDVWLETRLDMLKQISL